MLVKVLIDNISKDELLCEWGLSVYIEYRDKKDFAGRRHIRCFCQKCQKDGH